MFTLRNVAYFSAAVAILSSLVSEATLADWNQTAIIQFLIAVVPAVERFARTSLHPEFTRFSVAAQWLFVPIYFFLAFRLLPFWRPEANAKFWGGFRKRPVAISIAVLIIVAMVVADWHPMHFPSVFQGTSYADYPTSPYSRLLASSKLISALFYWLLCFAEPWFYVILANTLVGLSVALKTVIHHPGWRQ